MNITKYDMLDKDTVEESMCMPYFGPLISELRVSDIVKVNVTSEKCEANYCSRGCCGQR